MIGSQNVSWSKEKGNKEVKAASILLQTCQRKCWRAWVGRSKRAGTGSRCRHILRLGHLLENAINVIEI